MLVYVGELDRKEVDKVWDRREVNILSDWRVETSSQGKFVTLSKHSTELHRTAPKHTALHRTAPHRTALHRIAPHRTALHCTALHRTAPHCTAPHCIALCCTAPNHSAQHSILGSEKVALCVLRFVWRM